MSQLGKRAFQPRLLNQVKTHEVKDLFPKGEQSECAAKNPLTL